MTTSIPCTGLNTEEVKDGYGADRGRVLWLCSQTQRGEGIHFTRYLTPKWLIDHMPMVGRAEAARGPDAYLPARTGRGLREVGSARRGSTPAVYCAFV